MSSQQTVNVIVLAAEVFPFVKVGGLADVIGALVKVLEELGANVAVITPGYKVIRHDMFGIRPYEPVPDFQVPMGPGFAQAEVYQTQLPGTGINVFFIGCADYFYRDGIYDDPDTQEGYPDNMERFVFFMKAALEVIYQLGRPIDVIHCHDWQTGLIPGFLRTNLHADPYFRRIGALFTIHNLAYQGLFPKESLYWAGIDYRHFYPTSPFEFWGKVNFMKVGIELADLVNTVSRRYALEIQSSAEFGHGLEGVLARRKEDLFGIVNGIDYADWDPAKDRFIPANFSAQDLSGKRICKSETLSTFGLPQLPGNNPLVGIVSRLVDQKGFDLIAEAEEEIASLDLQMVILGDGQRKYQELFQQMAAHYPEKFAVKLGFDDKLAHLIEAGSDMFLMPSKYEPCGLNQLYSLRYGTIPIVRAVGGLVDTVQNYDHTSDSGTGFSFTNYSSREMVQALRRALVVYQDPERWRGLMLRAMAQDWSWQKSARKYLELYRRIQTMRA